MSENKLKMVDKYNKTYLLAKSTGKRAGRLKSSVIEWSNE